MCLKELSSWNSGVFTCLVLKSIHEFLQLLYPLAIVFVDIPCGIDIFLVLMGYYAHRNRVFSYVLHAE